MRIGIFAKTFAVTGAGPVLRAVRLAGYQAAQFNFACLGLPSMPDILPSGGCEEIARASLETGVSIAAISGTYNMIHPDQAVRDQGMRRLGLVIGAAPAMGTELVTLCTGTRDPDDLWRWHPGNASPEAWRQLATELGRALDHAETHGVNLGIEPELGNVVSSAALASRLIGEMGSRRLKIVLDPANLFERASAAEIQTTVKQAVDLLAGHIVMAHAKDRRPDGSFCAAGAGVIDFGGFVRCLRGAGFDGPLITHGLAEDEAPTVARFLSAAVAESVAR